MNQLCVLHYSISTNVVRLCVLHYSISPMLSVCVFYIIVSLPISVCVLYSISAKVVSFCVLHYSIKNNVISMRFTLEHPPLIPGLWTGYVASSDNSNHFGAQNANVKIPMTVGNQKEQAK